MKRFVGILILFSIGFNVEGQFVKSIGIKIGTTLANQTWQNKFSSNILLKDYADGTFGALNVEFLKGNNFTIITEVQYTQKGCREGLPQVKINLPKGYSTYRAFDTRFNYISSSVLLKARFENRTWIPYCFLGPRLDYLLSYTSDYDFKTLEKYMNEKIWGLDYGFGLEYKMGIGGVSAEFRHHYDFDNMLDVPYSDNYSGLEVKNNAYIFNIGIKYYFKKRNGINLKNV